MPVRFVLNGEPVHVNAVEPHLTLLEWLRASGRTGTKEGCAEGECGACAVALLSADAAGRPRYQAVNSCLVPLAAVHEQSLVTVEGVADGPDALHPVQAALVERGGSQCGYCTPGFVVSLFCEYYRPGRDGYDPEAISGNLCRCTGYRPIADVARALPAPRPDDPRLAPLRAPLPVVSSFECGAGARFFRPTRLDEVFGRLETHPDAVLIAGGTDLMVEVTQRARRFDALIALDAVPELRRFELGAEEVVLGAGVPLAHLEERLPLECPGAVPLLEQLFPLFSSRLIRHRATLGGNLATASPIGDALPVLLALDAELTLASARGTRRIALADFLLGYRKTALAAKELIASVHLRLPLPKIQRFYKASKRVLDDISTASAAFALDLDAAGRVERLGAAFGGVGPSVVRADGLARVALGKPWTPELLPELLASLEGVGAPRSDARGSAEYRRALVGKLLEKFVFETAPGEEAA